MTDGTDYCLAADVFDPKYCQWKGGPECKSSECRKWITYMQTPDSARGDA